MTNTSIRNGQKLNTKYTLQNTSPSPNPYPSRASGGCNFNKLTTSAVKCTTKMVVPGTKIGDSLKVNRPASASLASLLVKRIKYEIRLGKPNRPMSTSPKKVEPILRVGPWRDEGPDLPITFQETYSTRMRGLLCKDERLALQGKEAGPHHYKKAPTPSQKRYA